MQTSENKIINLISMPRKNYVTITKDISTVKIHGLRTNVGSFNPSYIDGIITLAIFNNLNAHLLITNKNKYGFELGKQINIVNNLINVERIAWLNMILLIKVNNAMICYNIMNKQFMKIVCENNEQSIESAIKQVIDVNASIKSFCFFNNQLLLCCLDKKTTYLITCDFVMSKQNAIVKNFKIVNKICNDHTRILYNILFNVADIFQFNDNVIFVLSSNGKGYLFKIRWNKNFGILETHLQKIETSINGVPICGTTNKNIIIMYKDSEEKNKIKIIDSTDIL